MDSLGVCAEELYIVALQEALLRKLHGQCKTCLTAKGGQQAVGLFHFDYALYNVKCKGFDIDLVSHSLIGHDGSRVGVYEDDLKSLLLESTARLRACIVKFGSLSDNDRTRADNKYLFYITSEWHTNFLRLFNS